MDDKSSVRLGWEAMTRHPILWLLVMAWEFCKWGLGFLGDQMGFGWIRLDYNIGFMPTPDNPFWVKLMLPPAMPSAESLFPELAAYGGRPPLPLNLEWALASAGVIALITIIEPLLRAGYLTMLNATIHGVKPSMKVFWRGVRRFGLAQICLTLLWFPVDQLHQNWIQPATAPWLAQLLLFIAVLAFYMAQYVIITDDANVLQAFVGAPFVLFGHLGALLVPVALSGLVTALLTGILSALRVAYPPILIPLYAVAGTGLAAAMLAAVQEGIGTRSEPGMPWACKHCRAQNDLGKSHCVVCGKPAQDEAQAPKTAAVVATGAG